jgi:hypothetical protein
MPKQETFFEQQDVDRRVVVLKSYDKSYAHEVFNNMDEQALQHLWNALKPEENYEAADLPSLNNPDDVNGDAKAFLWDELVEQAVEDPRASPRLTSFFIVNEALSGKSEEGIYVSADWISAESFAKGRLAGIS